MECEFLLQNLSLGGCGLHFHGFGSPKPPKMKPTALQINGFGGKVESGMRGFLLQNLSLGGCGLHFHGFGFPKPGK